MMILRAFHSCWRLFTLDRVHLDAYCTQTTFKLRPVMPTLERNEMTECPRKSLLPTLIRITWHIHPFSTLSARSVSYRFFFHLCTASWFSSGGTVNSMRGALFFESGHFFVWIMWTGNWVCLENYGKFPAPFSRFILDFFTSSRAFILLGKLNCGFLGYNKLLVCCCTLCS